MDPNRIGWVLEIRSNRSEHQRWSACYDRSRPSSNSSKPNRRYTRSASYRPWLGRRWQWWHRSLCGAMGSITRYYKPREARRNRGRIGWGCSQFWGLMTLRLGSKTSTSYWWSLYSIRRGWWGSWDQPSWSRHSLSMKGVGSSMNRVLFWSVDDVLLMGFDDRLTSYFEYSGLDRSS